MTSDSVCCHFSPLDPNAPEFVPQPSPSNMIHFFDQASCRQSAPLGMPFNRFTDCDLKTRRGSSLLSTQTWSSSFDTECCTDDPDGSPPVLWESFVVRTDVVCKIVRDRLRVSIPTDLAELIVQFARPQYQLNCDDALLHEAYWTKDMFCHDRILDLCSSGSCAWIHPRLPSTVHQNFQVIVAVAFVFSEWEETTYNAMSESEETCDIDLDFEACMYAMDVDNTDSPQENNMVFVENMDFDFETAIDPNSIDFRRLQRSSPPMSFPSRQMKTQQGRILSESLVSPRWEIIWEEDKSGVHQYRISDVRNIRTIFNLWTHVIDSEGHREFFKNSVSVAAIVHESWESFEWHNIMASWSRSKMQMSLQVKDVYARSSICGYLPFQPVVYDSDTFRNRREIAIGKDILLSDDDQFKFFGFVREVAVDVWND